MFIVMISIVDEITIFIYITDSVDMTYDIEANIVDDII